MAQLPSNAGSLIGQRLDEYELVALLALGGTAEIYLARHAGVAGFEKYVVVKCLHDHLADDSEFVRMFLDEARLGARLDHSNIVQTIKLGQQNSRYYMVMEYLAGMSLSLVIRKAAERLPGGRLPVDLGLNLMAQACAGLNYAHNRRDSEGKPLNIVHRDISPQNLVIAFEGVLKIVDFGIAKAMGRDTRTQSGTIKGKFAYMSPEQCLAGDLDNRTDIFALGAVTHELLTGKRLFKRESTYDTYHAILDCVVPPPSEVNPELDPALDPVVLKALGKEREDRYPTAEAFGDALSTILHKRGKSVTHGAVSGFFDEHFATEIHEHGQRMRAFISGRRSTVDEHWGVADDGEGDVSMSELSESSPSPPGGPTPASGSSSAQPGNPSATSSASSDNRTAHGYKLPKNAPGVKDGVYLTSELSLHDANVIVESAGSATSGPYDRDDDTGDDDDDDDEGGDTRIELNPLDRVENLHARMAGNNAAKKSEPADTRASAGGERPGHRLPPGAPPRAPARSEDGEDDVDEDAETLMAGGSDMPGSAAAELQTILANNARIPDSGQISGIPARPPAQAAAQSPQGKGQGSGSFPDPSHVRTQIAPAKAAPGLIAAAAGSSKAASVADDFSDAANQRTQIATDGAPPGQFAGSADMRTQIAPEGGVGPGMGAQNPAPYEHAVQMPGQAPGASSDGHPSSAGHPAPYGGLLDDQRLPYAMPQQATPMQTDARMHLMSRLNPPSEPMPAWLLAVIFAIAVGVGLGVTLLLAQVF